MLYLDDFFVSMQGEARDTGLPTIFIRLFGCPVGCTYCDQPQNPKKKRRISIENLVNMCIKHKWCKNICITGGEPLIYEEVVPLAMELLYNDFKVSIETSGCVPIEECEYRRSFRYIMDVKCPSSGVVEKNIYENLLHLHLRDEVKYVIKDREDYEFMKKIMKSYPTQASVIVSPMFDDKGKAYIGKELVDWLIEDKLNIRVGVQLHKLLEVK